MDIVSKFIAPVVSPQLALGLSGASLGYSLARGGFDLYSALSKATTVDSVLSDGSVQSGGEAVGDFFRVVKRLRNGKEYSSKTVTKDRKKKKRYSGQAFWRPKSRYAFHASPV